MKYSLLVPLLGLLTLLGCAHQKGGPTTKEEIVRDDARRTERYLNEIPGCSSEEGAVPLAELGDRAADAPPPPRVRAYLLRDAGICTQMACNHECCNQCRGQWQLSANRNGEAPLLLLSPAPAWQIMDCSLRAVKAAAPPLEVIVTGTVQPHQPAEGDLPVPGPTSEIAFTSICGVK